jgi:hypothetical protein
VTGTDRRSSQEPAAVAPEHAPSRCHETRIDREVGNAARQGRGVDAEGVRKLHDLDIGVVLGLGRTVVQRHDLVDPGGGAEERHQRRLRPDDDAPRKPRQRLGEADELEGVAEPVIAADQDAAAFEGAARPDELPVPRPVPAGRARRDPLAQHRVADLPRRREIAAPHRRRPRIVAERRRLVPHPPPLRSWCRRRT